MSSNTSAPSLNALAGPLVESLVADAAKLRLIVAQENGARTVDAGANARGSIEAGRRIAEICLGGLGTVTIAPIGPVASWPYTVVVHSADPVLACLGSQYAGWSLADEEGDSGFFALGSGPGRAVAVVEEPTKSSAIATTRPRPRSSSNPAARRRPRWSTRSPPPPASRRRT